MGPADKYYRQKQFECWTVADEFIDGVVSGRVIPAEKDVGPEIADLKIEANVFMPPGYEKGIPYSEYKFTPAVREFIEREAVEMLCEEGELG